MVNRVVLVGRLTRDPELRRIASSNAPVVNFTLAMNRRFGENETTDFIPCVVWNKPAENMAQYLSKGSLISVEGKIQSRNYTAQDGSNRTSVEVLADSISFLEPRKQGSNNYGAGSNNPTNNYSAKPNNGGNWNGNNNSRPQTTNLDAIDINSNDSVGSTSVEISDDDLPW